MNYEEELRYLANVVESPDRNWAKVIEDLNLPYNPDSVRKAFACTPYSGYAVYKYFTGKDNNPDVSEDELRRIETLKDEFYKEKMRYTDKLRTYNAKLREESRFENLKAAMLAELANIKPPRLYKNVTYTPQESRVASLLISDIHYGIKVDNQVNYYDCEVAKDRLEQIAGMTCDMCKDMKVKTLNICILGDVVNGIINVSNRIEQEEDIMTQIINVGNILTEFIINISAKVPEVKIYTVWGNHARIPSINAAKKNDTVNRENLERLVYHFIKTMLPTHKIVTSMNDDYLVTHICGDVVVMEHGDKGSSNPIYGYTNILHEKPDIIFRGHDHEFSVKTLSDTKIVTNGSLVGTDDYALSLRVNSQPSQTFIVHNPLGQKKGMAAFELVVH